MIVASLPKRLCPATLSSASCFSRRQALRLDLDTAQVMGSEVLTFALWVDDVENLCRVGLHLGHDSVG